MTNSVVFCGGLSTSTDILSMKAKDNGFFHN